MKLSDHVTEGFSDLVARLADYGGTVVTYIQDLETNHAAALARAERAEAAWRRLVAENRAERDYLMALRGDNDGSAAEALRAARLALTESDLDGPDAGQALHASGQTGGES